MSKDHNTITCTHGKGLACSVCYDQTHNLSVCSEACNCMKCNPSKSSCIALRASELGLPYIDVSTMTKDEFEAIPAPVRARSVLIGQHMPVGSVTFGELEDGEYFYPAMTYAYGSRRQMQKVMEDGEHNAVWADHTHIGELVPGTLPVIRVNK